MKFTGIIHFGLVSAVLMSLGWGLRGYIGGGPLGAMIPGAFIALWLCMLLRLPLQRAAIIAAFSAVGVGIGGEMTYGQTLGFLRHADTVWWGLLGTIVKGGVWGLLGGAFIGLGFVVTQLTMRRVMVLFFVFLLAIVLGVALINQPKFIYFSDPINKPRDEIWAGLLFGAVALLAMLHRWKLATLPLRFALFGLPAGMLGFGGGAAIMAWGHQVDPTYQAWPWWKTMEFFFGACLGLGYGAAAMRMQVTPAEEAAEPRPWSAFTWLLSFVIFALGLLAWNAFAETILASAPEHPIIKPIGMVLLGYSTFGCVALLLALRSQTFAWQVAVTLTFIPTLIDLQDDMVDLPTALGNYYVRWGIVWLAAGATVALVLWWQRNSRQLPSLLLALMWACVVVAFLRLPLEVAAVLPADGPDTSNLLARTWGEFLGSWQVHGGFLVMALAVTMAIAARARATISGSQIL